MKKFIQSALAIAVAAMTFTACEDVPAPFDYGYEAPEPEVTPEAAGEGTLASPYNVAKALDIITAGTYTTDKVYVKGIVTKIDNIDTSYGNSTYYLGDTKTATTTLEVYRGYYYGGTKFTTGSEIAVGDTILVQGVLINYNGTKEITQGSSIITINGKDANGNTGGSTNTGSTVAPAGEGTAASPYNVAKAMSITTALAADTPTDEVYVEGIIVSTPNIDITKYGSATFYISDDGSTNGQYYIYGSKYFNGDSYTATDQLKAGDKVVLVGKLVNYKGNTPEMTTGGKLYSLNGTVGGSTSETGGETSTPTGTSVVATIDGTTVTAANPNVTPGTTTVTFDATSLTQESATDATTFTLSDGTTITFAGGTNTTNTPKFYTTGGTSIRMYANNTFTVAAKAKVAKIVITCVTSYTGNATQTIVFDGNNAVYTNTNSVNSGGTQLRVQTITITYAQ
jgi:hypothetical protein